MTTPFFKSLDRPVDIFGVKGKWIIVFLVLAGLFVFMALVLGFAVRSGVGISVAIIGILGSFVLCYILQGKVSHRQLSKIRASGKIYPAVVRHRSLCHILLSSGHKSWFYDAQMKRDSGNEIVEEQ